MAPVDDLVPPDPAGPPDAHPTTDLPPEPALLVLDTPAGPHLLGAPTVDSDADGRADTALTGERPGLGLATDVDGDGHVDVLTTIGADGAATTTHLGPPPAAGPLPDPTAGPTAGPGPTPDPAPDRWDEGAPPPPPVLDPTTGRWIRSA